MYEQFGATVTNHSVQFKLFFPDKARDPFQYINGDLPRIAKIQVTGDFQSHLGQNKWDHLVAPSLTKKGNPNGWLYTYQINNLPDGFYQYKYFVTYENGTTRWCGDPCTKYVATQDENAGFVVGGNDVVVNPLAQRLPFNDLITYELMIDDFTKAYRGGTAPVDAVKGKLDYLIELGINAIEFMPWTAWRGSEFSWGYDPFLFFAVENRYIEDPTNPLDRLYRLKTLINELHLRGIHVIMDGVFNHVSAGVDPGQGFPYHWLYQNPSDSPFTGGFGDGGYFEDLDFNNTCTQQFIFDVCKYWLDEYQLDGIRFDYVKGFYLKGDRTRGITKLVTDLRAHLSNINKTHITLMLEHLPDNRYEAVAATNDIGATACWYDRFFYDVPEYAAHEQVKTQVIRVMDTARDFDQDKGPVVYIENHDHSTIMNRVGGQMHWWRIQPALLALFTAPGSILIHNGQEFGDDHALPHEGPERVQSRPVRWELLAQNTGKWLFDLHQRCIELRQKHPSLRSANYYPRFYDEQHKHFDPEGYGIDVDKDIVIYHRWGQGEEDVLERFIIVLNFSAYEQYVDIPFSINGVWFDKLNDGIVEVKDFRLRDHKIESHWGRLFYKKG
jgi:pullulanase